MFAVNRSAGLMRLAAVLIAFCGTHSIAAAAPLTGPILLDFNVGIPATMSPQAYFNSVFGPGVVTVSGANWGNGYNGEGHLVGPWLSDGGKNFLMTKQQTDSDTIKLTLNQPVYGVSFNFQIFPDASDPDGRVQGSTPPDFSFNAGDQGSALTNYLHAFGVLPNSTTEFAPQLFSSGSFAFPNGVNELDFVDWPATIGVNNLTLTFGTPQLVTAAAVPEPTTLLIFAAALVGAGAGAYLRKRVSVAGPSV